MEWIPLASVDVLKVALPAERAPVPMIVVPSLNVTVPVGVPEVALTVAVKVTGWPKVDGFNEEARVVVVATAVGLGSTNTTASSFGEACVGLQLLHFFWNPLTTVAGLVLAKNLSER